MLIQLLDLMMPGLIRIQIMMSQEYFVDGGIILEIEMMQILLNRQQQRALTRNQYFAHELAKNNKELFFHLVMLILKADSGGL